MKRIGFNSLDNFPEGYEREEWELVVSVFESLSRPALARLCLELGIDFENRNQDVDKDNLIFVLTNGSDVSPVEAVRVAREYRSGIR